MLIHYIKMKLLIVPTKKFYVVVVFDLNKSGNIAKAIKGEKVGTLIEGSRNAVAASS